MLKSSADAAAPQLGDIYCSIVFPPYDDSESDSVDPDALVVELLSDAMPAFDASAFPWEKPKIAPSPVPENYADLSTDELSETIKTLGLDQFSIYYHDHDQRWSMSWRLKSCSGGLEDPSFRKALLCCVGQIASEQERLGIRNERSRTG